MVARRLLNTCRLLNWQFDACRPVASGHVDVPIPSKSHGHCFMSWIRVGSVVKDLVSGIRC